MNKRFEIRHPEKLKNQSLPMSKKPSWIKVKAPLSEGYKETRKLVKQNNLKTDTTSKSHLFKLPLLLM